MVQQCNTWRDAATPGALRQQQHHTDSSDNMMQLSQTTLIVECGGAAAVNDAAVERPGCNPITPHHAGTAAAGVTKLLQGGACSCKCRIAADSQSGACCRVAGQAATALRLRAHEMLPCCAVLVCWLRAVPLSCCSMLTSSCLPPPAGGPQQCWCPCWAAAGAAHAAQHIPLC